MNWFDEYGVYVQGASDHLVFANLEADSMIPQGAQPLGFYVNESAPGSVMNEDCGLSKFRNRGGAEKAAAVQYTAKDFQLEVLGETRRGCNSRCAQHRGARQCDRGD